MKLKVKYQFYFWIINFHNFKNNLGPFDGILGFSQGGCLASILCAIANNDIESEKTKYIKFKFGIIIAGFKSRQSQHDIFYDLNKKIDLPTLHVFGDGDKVIPSEMASDLCNYFLNPKILRHEQGHFIPGNSESKNNFIDFLNQFKQINNQ